MPTREPTTVELSHALPETLGRLVRRIRAEEPGPAVGRLVVLGRLEREGPTSISALASAERMRPQSMAQTVRELEADGLTSRSADPDDGRKVVVELTATGRELLHATRARRETWLAEVLERELEDDERLILEQALALLERVAAA
jgi:DNA-binding MarR family transcriptional regulator